MEKSLSEYIQSKQSWFGVIPRGDLLDLTDKSLEHDAVVAWFRYHSHADNFGRGIWGDFFTIVKSDGPIRGSSKNQ